MSISIPEFELTWVLENGKWGMGNGEWVQIIISSRLPIPILPPIFYYLLCA
ncbi:MAG: hypothetical protein PUP91_35220 [Rhizonema sp. PD37]|nr:hypothetical protein [Rhizonema sp. PD37]